MELMKKRRGRKRALIPTLTLCKGGIAVFNVYLSTSLDERKGIVWCEEKGYLAFKNEEGMNSYAINTIKNNKVSRIPVRVEQNTSVNVRMEGKLFLTDYKL